MERLQKIIANSGYTSRRKAETLIEQGKVKLNDQIAKLGDKASPEDKITINNIPLKTKTKNQYYILNKPKGVLVTKTDPKNRKTIYDLKSLKNLGRLKYVGRLDAMSEGLLILTSDGNLIQKLTHPKHHIPKTYQLRTSPLITKQDIAKLKEGMLIESRKFYAKVSNKNNNTFHLTIHEGRNRIIRKVMQKLGYKIFQLKRVSVGNLELGNLGVGEVREILESKMKTQITQQSPTNYQKKNQIVLLQHTKL